MPVACDEPLGSVASDCCDDDSVERGWYNSRLVLACPEGGIGAVVVIPYAQFWSDESQEAADALALEQAESQLFCTFYSAEASAVCEVLNEAYHSLEEESIGPGFQFYTGTYAWPTLGTGSITIPAGTVTSTISQEDANEQAQLLADSLLECTPEKTFVANTFWPVDEFGIDDCEMYYVGSLSGLYGGYGWVASVVPFTPIDYLVGFDSAESYAIGTITSLPGGTDWAAAGILFTPS